MGSGLIYWGWYGIFDNLFGVMLEALPFLAFGFFMSGLLKSFVPSNFIAKHLGRKLGFAYKENFAFLGTPIPLCSCSVIPVTMEMRRSGAGKGSVSSFLISAPETGFDSLSISYAMLGPLMTVTRLISALITAISTAWIIVFATRDNVMPEPEVEKSSCCASKKGAKGDDSKKSLKVGILTRFVGAKIFLYDYFK